MNLNESVVGVGLRPHHYPKWHTVDHLPFFEILTDNYIFQEGGPALAHLALLSQRTSIAMHGVGMNVGGEAEIQADYLKEVKKLADLVQPIVVSDHFCFTRTAKHTSFDLLPVVRDSKKLDHIVGRVNRIQDFLGRELALENVSSYVSWDANEMSELEFLDQLSTRTGSRVLLDVNNVFVNAFNFDFDAKKEISRISPQHVVQYHLAGHTVYEDYLHDTHDAPVTAKVWDLFAHTLGHIGARPTIIERDDDVEWEELMEDQRRAHEIVEKIVGSDAHSSTMTQPLGDKDATPRT